MYGVKHLIECHCILPQFSGLEKQIYHKFVVFSIIDDDNKVAPTFVKCNNCDVVHKIYDIKRSEICLGDDRLQSLKTVEDVKLSIPDALVKALENYNAELPTWEQVEYILDNKKFDEIVILSQEQSDGSVRGKKLEILSETRFKITQFIHQVEF
jgi:hypothetical protein